MPAARNAKSIAARVTHLVPIRYGRMLHSPFTFLRGSTAVMAWDLGHRPHSKLVTQLCGDCHLGNFGGFASPERALLLRPDLRRAQADLDTLLPENIAIPDYKSGIVKNDSTPRCSTPPAPAGWLPCRHRHRATPNGL